MQWKSTKETTTILLKTAMATEQPVPKTHRALVLTSRAEKPQVQTIPTPQVGPGSAVIRIIQAGVLSYHRDIYSESKERPYPFPLPLVTGVSAVGRIAAVGSDATSLKPGQLVFVDSYIHARDNPSVGFLSGIHEGYTSGSQTLMRGEWKDSTHAEYAKMPLENCHALDEDRILGSPDKGGLGYLVEELAALTKMAVAYGGLDDINLKAGETIIVAPATGAFGGAAVEVAVAMGARVIAMGRNLDVLKSIAARHERVDIVQMTGNLETELDSLRKFGNIDACYDISPPFAGQSTHLKSSILALRHGGRVSLMGGFRGDVPMPYSQIMHNNLLLRGKWMYDNTQMKALIKMVETGVLKLGERAGLKCAGKFVLEDSEAAFTKAENYPRASLVLIP
ncbi:Hypothetical protein R9X50_00596900 [Acrodontium crateriforme]|uniref:Alcohol dehydrogenase n=1 Tax=Acrodontium crateriforme TaxID=150365 RepID=A0AAQ3M7J0_9PEZI|nr:Hypothetical protein R9X50_00596900 [Acrodontium crateriforme]